MGIMKRQLAMGLGAGEQSLLRTKFDPAWAFHLVYVNAEHDSLLEHQRGLERLWMGRVLMSTADHLAEIEAIAATVRHSTGQGVFAAILPGAPSHRPSAEPDLRLDKTGKQGHRREVSGPRIHLVIRLPSPSPPQTPARRW